MSDDKDDGRPAFPHNTHRGMMLRDYFAAKALGRHTGGYLIGYEDHAPEHRAELIRRLTRDCWEIADAMLKERSK